MSYEKQRIEQESSPPIDNVADESPAVACEYRHQTVINMLEGEVATLDASLARMRDDLIRRQREMDKLQVVIDQTALQRLSVERSIAVLKSEG